MGRDSTKLKTTSMEALDKVGELRDEVAEMLALAERLREAHGGELDDASIDAVSEITGASPEFVRVALRSAETKKAKVGFGEKLRNVFLSFDPDVRTVVQGGVLATGFAIAFGFRSVGDPGGLLAVLSLLFAIGGAINSGLARTQRVASICGAITGSAMVLMTAIVLAILSLFWSHGSSVISIMVLLYGMGGAVIGTVAHKILAARRQSFGLKDPAVERQEMLKQLVELQDKLRQDKQSMTFVSIDMAGSTQMKMSSDPLAVEYTFNEYHKYVETVVKKHGGEVHSTAGDGVTAAFDEVQKAFSAMRQLQSGLIELNTHRNRIGIPIQLRVGIHSGEVMGASDGVEKVNFSSVIDVAAHLQKVCPLGGIAVSEHAGVQLQGGLEAIGTDTAEVQGVAARIWKPRASLDGLSRAMLPPIPGS